MPDISATDLSALRNQLVEENTALDKIAPTLSHLLATPDHSLFSDEILARIRGMCRDLARQMLRAQAEATGKVGSEAFADQHGETLTEYLYTIPKLLTHCHAMAIEWQLANRMEAQAGLDPVLSPLIQHLVASEESGVASAAMAALAAQARFAQTQRRMELPLAELPGDLLHELLTAWRESNGEARSDAMIRAEAKLRNSYDEASGRAALFARLVAGMGKTVMQALDVDRAGVALFVTALAARSKQSRAMVVSSTHETQISRLAVGLRAAGLDASGVESQILRLHPQSDPPRGLDAISPEEASQWLAESGRMGGG